MFEKLRIKEHMEVADCKGIHVGTSGDEGHRTRLIPRHSDPISGSDKAPPGFCRSGAFLWDGSKIEPNYCAQAVFG